MPSIDVNESCVTITLSWIEALGGFVRGVQTLPLSAVAKAWVAEHPWSDHPWRGIRVGTGCPCVVSLLLF